MPYIFSMVSGKEKTSAKTEWQQKHLVDIYLPTLETWYSIAVIYSQ